MESYEVEIDGKTYQGVFSQNACFFEMCVGELIFQDKC